mmetsp:Transcript_1425/g.2416  ORF Transcript_1425/g.2416 Transcript_1425/m.2416 type:complete len:137 (-) Transcript_1425:366-776(-)
MRNEFGCYADEQIVAKFYEGIHEDPKGFALRNTHHGLRITDRMKVGRERLNKRIKAFKPKIPENFTSDLTLGELKKDLPFQRTCAVICQCDFADLCDQALAYIVCFVRQNYETSKHMFVDVLKMAPRGDSQGASCS